MGNVLDESWNELRGMEIVSVAVASISYTDDSVKLINMRNEGAMLGDPSVREGYVQGSIARGMEAAGKNDAGAMTGFMGMGMGMNANGSYLSQAAQNNQEQIKQQAEKQNQQTAQGAMILGHVQSAELKIRENSVLTVGQPSQLQMSNQSYKWNVVNVTKWSIFQMVSLSFVQIVENHSKESHSTKF